MESYFFTYLMLSYISPDPLHYWCGSGSGICTMDYGSGSEFWTLLFSLRFLKVFSLLPTYLLKVHLHQSSKVTSYLPIKEPQNCRNQGFFKFFLLVDDGIWIRTKLQIITGPDPEHCFHWQPCHQMFAVITTFTLGTSVADPGSGIGCLFDPWIRDPGREKVSIRIRDPGWTTRIIFFRA